jgi:hypothetical protein
MRGKRYRPNASPSSTVDVDSSRDGQTRTQRAYSVPNIIVTVSAVIPLVYRRLYRLYSAASYDSRATMRQQLFASRFDDSM